MRVHLTGDDPIDVCPRCTPHIEDWYEGEIETIDPHVPAPTTCELCPSREDEHGE